MSPSDAPDGQEPQPVVVLSYKLWQKYFFREQAVLVQTLLSCVDSCPPAKILFKNGMGDVFNARVAGNIENPHILGSMEFTTKVAGAKLVLGMGHSACGAVVGAIANAKLGNLTQARDSPGITRSGLGKRVSVQVPKRLAVGAIARQTDPSQK